MSSAHFQQLAARVCDFVSGAQSSLHIAVCWFSHRDIFACLLEKIRQGVRVELILEYDTQNIQAEGLDFQQMIRLGGHLYARCAAGLMHHKFAIADQQYLLTGSFNWTYNSNAENLLITTDGAAVAAFLQAFHDEKAISKRIFTVQQAEARPVAPWALFENTRFTLADLRRKVGSGIRVWVIRADKMHPDLPLFFRQNRLWFDARKQLFSYWQRCRTWDAAVFNEWLPEQDLSPAHARTLRRWAVRMRTGDVVFATTHAGVRAAGIVQSVPQRADTAGHSTFRDVQWLKITENPVALKEALPTETCAAFKGSALQLLQVLFEN
jgi:hypothetical protein